MQGVSGISLKTIMGIRTVRSQIERILIYMEIDGTQMLHATFVIIGTYH